MSYVIEVPKTTALPVEGETATFPVRRIYCVGRNYADHAREMGHDPDREPPFFFQKPTDAIVPNNQTIPFPVGTKDLHHEIELVVAIGTGGKNIPQDKALDHVYGYGVGLDMTRRDLQDEAKQLRRPWETGKSSDSSGPVGPIYPVSAVGHLGKGRISLSVDGQMRQDADLADMVWSVAEQIAILSSYYELKAGDVIFSGTPEGVGRVDRGQVMVGAIDGLGEIHLKVV